MTRSSQAALTGALVAVLASTSAAQSIPPRTMAANTRLPAPSYVIVDGDRLPSLPGLLDSLRLGRFAIDSSVAPERRRVAAAGAPGGAVYFPVEDNIQSVEILKGRRAVDFYGSDAANGVIVVTTKRPSVPRGR